MPDTSLLFIAGTVGTVVLSLLFVRLWHDHPPRRLGIGAAVAATAAFAALAAWLALATLDRWYRVGTWQATYWILLGRGSALLFGCLAGIILGTALGTVRRWTPQVGAIGTFALMAGTGVAVLVLYLLGVPGVFQSLGLTGIKAGGVEITLATPRAGPGGSVAGFHPVAGEFAPVGGPSGGARLSDKHTPWYENLWPMFRELPDPPALRFLDRGYFQREAAYLEALDPGVALPITATIAEANPPTGAAKAIWQQEVFLRSLRPLVGCGGYYHQSFPDPASGHAIVWPVFETLVALEGELEDASLHPASLPDRQADLDRHLDEVSRAAGIAIKHLRAALPRSKQQMPAGQDAGLPSWGDCNTAMFQDDDVNPRLQIAKSALAESAAPHPPYLAMFLANVYAALGAKDAGLEILNNWIEYYTRYRDADPAAPRWLLHRAVWEYGVVQEADEAMPSTAAEVYYLDKTRTLIEADWGLDLDIDGYDCAGPDYRAAADRFVPGTPQSDRAAVRARLDLLYQMLLQRLLYAIVETRTGFGDRAKAPQYERWARQLIASAGRCLVPESDDWRVFRQSLNRVFGGVMLARLAAIGPRLGLYGDAAAAEVRMEALRALRQALPVLQGKEDAEMAAGGPGGSLRLRSSGWGVYRRIAQQEILDLQAELTK